MAFTIPAAELALAVARERSDRAFAVRDRQFDLKFVASYQEANYLASSGMVEGRASKKGIHFLALLVPPRVALRFIGRATPHERLPIAEDNFTVRREIIAGGVVYKHIHVDAWADGRAPV